MARQAIDLTGQRFGRLVAIRDIGSLRSFRLWEFRCDCGAIVARPTSSVRSGKTTSCGCFQREESSKRRSSDIAGQVFGRLTAVERLGPNEHRHVVWSCICECGRSAKVAAVSLKKGTRSCGCLRSEAASRTQKAKALPPDVKAASRKASAAKQRRKRSSEPLAVMQARLSRLHRHALSRVGGIKASPTLDQLGYSAEALVAHIERQFLNGMSWANMHSWQIDHIVPASTAKTVEDVVALNQLSNLRPMWAKDNNAKKARRTHLL